MRNCSVQRLEIGQPRAELLALLHVVDGAVEAELRAAERAGADVEPPAVEPRHGDLETLAFAADAVGDRHTAILEHHHGGRLRFPAEFLFRRAVGQAGRALLHHDAGNAARAGFAGARHHHVNVGDAAAGDEGLGAVEHVSVAVAARARRKVGGVRAGVRLGQAVAGEMLHAAELGQEFLALGLAAGGRSKASIIQAAMLWIEM